MEANVQLERRKEEEKVAEDAQRLHLLYSSARVGLRVVCQQRVCLCRRCLSSDLPALASIWNPNPISGFSALRPWAGICWSALSVSSLVVNCNSVFEIGDVGCTTSQFPI